MNRREEELSTEHCIDTRGRASADLGYRVVRARDGHTTCDASFLSATQIIAHHDEILGSGFVELAASADLAF